MLFYMDISYFKLGYCYINFVEWCMEDVGNFDDLYGCVILFIIVYR